MAKQSAGVQRSVPNDDPCVVCVNNNNDGEAGIPKSFNLRDFKKLNDFLRHLGKVYCSRLQVNGAIIKDGELISTDSAYAGLKNGDVLSYEQDARKAALFKKEDIFFVPHFDTLVKGGLYEYYASEGTNPIPYAFAELIDNALEATARNKGLRKIELRLNLDETGDHNSLVVLDNGQGMTSKQLNNWAIYRLSKFNRKDSGTPAKPPSTVYVPKRSLNSDISYFGVGGKQAAFFIGNSVKMITKSCESEGVHELCISTDEFQRKEKQCESVYKGSIITRSQRTRDDVFTSEDRNADVLTRHDECGKESFTFVVIQGISHQHALYLKHNFKSWCRQLAHIYHYYVHGPEGNVSGEERSYSSSMNIDIEVNMNARGSSPKKVHLCDIDDDMQSLFIQSAASTFEFRATVDGGGVVEGILRYHPFLYDCETYPKDVSTIEAGSNEIEDEEGLSTDTKFLTKNQVFECFWNGRLIPHTRIQDLDWCSVNKKSKNIPVECFNRISGVLWTNDIFEVSTNKLTFMDFGEKLRSKNTVFCRVFNSQEKRGNIDKQFNDWLQECHERLDKQILFTDFEGLVTRPEMPKTKQYPWSMFKSVTWDGKVYKRGLYAKLLRVVPIQHGTIKRFLLYGDHGGDVYATGGFIELVLEPKSLYGEVKVHPLTKLDRDATQHNILKWIEEEEIKLPDRLVISWPEGGEVRAGDKICVGTTIGAIKVEINNRKGEAISKIPGSNQKKLLVELKVIYHSSAGDTTIVNHICHHAKTWPYWFKKMENITNLGAYTLQLQAVLNESSSSFHAGKELPSHRIRFSAIEAEASAFTANILSGPFYVGEVFQVPLQFQDRFGHLTRPPDICTPSLEATGLALRHGGTEVKGSYLLLKNVAAIGLVDSSNGKTFQLKLKIVELPGASQSIKIKFFPGPPSQLLVTPKLHTCDIENGNSLNFQVQVHDVAGNSTSAQNLTVTCKFIGRHSNLPTYSAVCSANGQANLTGPPLKLANISGSDTLKAIIEAQSHKNVPCVEKIINVLPSSNAARIEVSYEGSTGEQIEIHPDKELQYKAGEVITGVVYKLFDEAGRRIDLTPTLAPSVVVNWGPPRTKSDFLLDGKLPDITVSQTTKDTIYCYIHLEGTSLKFNFIIKPLPGEPASLKCTCSGSNSVRLGEPASDIFAEPVDIYGNSIKKLTKSALPFLSVSAEGLCTEKLVRAVGQADVFLIQGVTFVSGALGPRKVCIYFKDVMGQLKLDVIAGLPASIFLPNYDDDDDMYTVTNGKPLPNRLMCELRDEHGNLSNEAGFKVQFICDPHVKMTPNPQIIQTDKHGRVDFGAPVVNVRSSTTTSNCPDNLCGQNCYGVYAFFLKTSQPTSRRVIRSSDIKLHIKPDSLKPAKLEVDYNQNAEFVAGKNLPDFTVHVIAEDGSLLTNITSDQVVMNIWQEDGIEQKNPKMITLSPVFSKSTPIGHFLFRNFETPYCGSYRIQFILKHSEFKISSALLPIVIEPNVPVKLVSQQALDTSIVSNTPNSAGRTISNEIKLQLEDFFGNTTKKVHGKLTVKVTSRDKVELPTLVGGARGFEVSFKDGIICLPSIMVEENSSGVDGHEYYLNCTAIVVGLPNAIQPFVIPFTFYNDAAKQEEVLDIIKERSAVIAEIEEMRSCLVEYETVLAGLSKKVNTKGQEEENILAELSSHEIPSSSLASMESIEALINKKLEEKESLLRAPRRKCNVAEIPKEPDVLGKVCHLAQVEDNDIARVLSWHMGRYMDCIVTTTSKKAMEIYNRTGNLQQVLALDSLFRKSLPNWNKPLPHLKIRGYQAKGNPIYARDLLIFKTDPDNCKLVFGQLLGDTIILDTIDEASVYRRDVVKHTFCPTLLTRTGDRIQSSGILGGRDNKAPAINMPKGVQFAQPIALEHTNLSSLIEVLQVLKRAKSNHMEATTEYHLFRTEDRLKRTKETEERISKKEERLHELEGKLASHNSSRPASALPQRSGSVSKVVSARSTRATRDIAGPSNVVTPRASSRRQTADERNSQQTPDRSSTSPSPMSMSTRKRIGPDNSVKDRKRTRK